MKKIILFSILLCALKTFSQDAAGVYTVGILQVTSTNREAEMYASSVQSLIADVFSQKNRFTVVDRTKFDQLSRERNLQKQEDFINSKFVVEQGKSLGAQYVISANKK